ncbi:ABC-F family ATP-binding cassette domain-containing protein [Luteithermobacter gelatinilyticus]|uniref:ABC-F family ATP-binding cassette domain-containing protein n=1 Tax=Luteithermobacter gelatinilyticus TaxID=2582913 RepID=UPI0011075BC4|nr:ABC-F family ATP-binding cassette domain-containing protein [Luteithermobacter gelatinilyticus]
MLTITDLTYRIAGKTLLEGASLSLPDGHKVGLIGRNGVGKSTLFKLVLGDAEPDEGEIRLRQGISVGQVAQEAPDGPQSLLETVLAAHKELNALEQELKVCCDPLRLAEIHERLTVLDAHSAESRAAEILAGLGFDNAAQQRPCHDFSGGWRMRVALACTLFTRPELLLLDEPTNYLDLEGVMWLENFIRSYPHTVMIISHDRDLLNRAVAGIVHLEDRKLTYYAGTYDVFEKTQAEQRQIRAAQIKKQEAARAHMQKFVDRFRYKASKAKQAQSRLKMLEKMEPLAKLGAERTVTLQFPNPEQLPPPLMMLENVAVGYEPDKPVLKRLNLRIDMDDRIALLGQNGNGKSTFAKLLSRRLDATSGQIKAPAKLRIGYFAQHQKDELDPSGTPVEHMARLMAGETDTKVRARLGAFGFGADKADTLVRDLSGGEKARLLFALMSFEAPHLMILDEPTNHLDMQSREALMRAINDYEGAVILISHDPYLVEACADRLWLVKDGTITQFDGDMADYRKLILQTETPSAPPKGGNNRKNEKRNAAQQRTILAPLRKAVEEAERRVDALTREIAKYDRALSNPKLYDPDDPKAKEALTKFTREKAELEKQLDQAEIDWMEKQDKLEQQESGF